jgi:hypothetical protein
MGCTCISTNNTKKTRGRILTNNSEPVIENKKNTKILNPDEKFKKNLNPNSIIENQTNTTILKAINQINGDAIRISNNKNCIIIIMDASSSVIIQDCKKCSIFIAPCSSSILMRNSKQINLISISQQLRITNVNESNLFIFSMTSPAIENCSDIKLGMFCVQFVELSEMLKNSKINIWENHWSQFQIMGNEENISFADNNTKKDVIDMFSAGFNNNCYVNFDQYQFIPYTFGRAVQLKNYFNFLLIFKSEDASEDEIIKFLNPDDLKENESKCICTKIVKSNSNEFNQVCELANNANNKELFYFLNKRNLNKRKSVAVFDNNNFDMGSINEKVGNINNLEKGDLLFIWFGYDSDDLSTFNDYLGGVFEEGYYALITNKDVNLDENTFLIKLMNLYDMK